MQSLRQLPKKSRDLLPIWSEFNQLSMKYNSINLCHGSPVLNPPQFLIDNLAKACADGFNQYTAFAGHPIFREKLAKFFSPMFNNAKSTGINPNSEIIVTTGACEALFSTFNALLEKGDEVLTFEPYYTSYVNYVEFAGGKLTTSPMVMNPNGDW